MGLYYTEEKKLDEAKESYKAAKELDNKNKEGYYERIIQFEMLELFPSKNWDGMIKIYTDFIEAKIEFHKDYKQTTKWYVAVAYLNKNDLDNARKMLKEVIAVDADSPTGKQAATYLKKIGDGNGF